MGSALSIIVLNHNHKACLPFLFDSILAQQDITPEIVLVDDYSDEPCADVVEAYRSKGLFITLLTHNERLYIKNARVAGMRAASGDILAFADADDRLLGEHSLAANVRLFAEKDADILHFRSAFINENGKFQRYFSLSDPFAEVAEGRGIFSRWLETDIRGTVVWNKLYSRELCLSICDTAQQSKVLRNVEEIFLTSLFFLHAGKYVNSDIVGYGYNWAERGWRHEAGCALYAYYLLMEMLPYMRETGCPEAMISRYSQYLEHHIALTLGHAVRGAAADEDAVDWMLGLADPVDWMRVMLLGGRVNADKVVGSFRLLRNGPPGS